MAKYKVNHNLGLQLPVLCTVNGEEIINNMHINSQQVVECSEETEEMRQQLKDGRLIKLESEGHFTGTINATLSKIGNFTINDDDEEK